VVGRLGSFSAAFMETVFCYLHSVFELVSDVSNDDTKHRTLVSPSLMPFLVLQNTYISRLQYGYRREVCLLYDHPRATPATDHLFLGSRSIVRSLLQIT
jgi:hypothetical protein